MSFRVSKVIDGDTFKVSPNWKWNDEEGDTVRAHGYDTPEEGQEGYQKAKEKLEDMIFGKYVELKNPVKITYGRLLCDVYVDGKDLASFFSEYK